MFFFKKFRHKNVILISIDTLRFDCVGYQPDKKELHKCNVVQLLETPTLDKLSENALCFTQCISTNTYTTSAHASLFTGLLPPHHGVRAFFYTRLKDDIKTLPEIFREKGYKTVLATDVLELFKPLGLTRGFDMIFERNDRDLFTELDKLRRHKVFLFAHFFDVHEPYLYCENPPNLHYNDDYYGVMEELYNRHGLEIKDKRPHALWNNLANHIGKTRENLFKLYVRGVNKFDSGRFSVFINNLKNIKFLDGSLTVILSDHGEGKCDHYNPELFTHGGDPYDNVLRIPLIIKHPEFPHKIDNKLFSIVDIFSLIIELSGIKFTPDYEPDITIPPESREVAYAENWVAIKGGYLCDDIDGKPFIPHSSIPDNLWLLKHRILRTQKYKFWIKGKQEDIFDSTSNLTDEEFVKSLYCKLLVRWEDEEGLKHHTETLSKGIRTREDKIIEFLSSEEYNLQPKFYFYDLPMDPFEETPLLPTRDIAIFSIFNENIKKILQIEKSAVSSEKIFSNKDKDKPANSDEEKEKIMKQLKDLGYF